MTQDVTRHILVVDDEPAQLKLAEKVLVSNGYGVITASNGYEAIRIVYEEHPDLVLLDIMMPELDGWQTCRCIREAGDVPVIMLSGKRTSEADVVRGLDYGADDYLSKPVGNKELLARVRAVLRRADKPSSEKGKKKLTYCDDTLTVDVDERKVAVNGEKVRLTPREFRLLALLVENPDHVLSHQQVLEKVWGWEYIDDVDYVRIYISHLRQKIEPDPSQPRYILTEPGVGYYFHSNI
jgi:two-component system KDP operon response regulator KdpE